MDQSQQACSGEVGSNCNGTNNSNAHQAANSKISALGLLIASFLTEGSYRGHYRSDGTIAEAAGTAMTILDSLRNPSDQDRVKAARGLEVTQQLRPMNCREDMGVEEVCRIVPLRYLCLFAAEVPGIPIDVYVQRLVCDIRCGIECFVMALVLILRCSCVIPICARSLHRAILTSVIIAAKTRDDKYYPMSFYARLGGTGKRELEMMEIAMLDMLGFDARVPTATYIDMLYSIRQYCATLAYVKRCDWAGRAWGELIEQVPVPRMAELSGEILGLRASTYNMSCDFTIHNNIASNYSELVPVISVPSSDEGRDDDEYYNVEDYGVLCSRGGARLAPPPPILGPAGSTVGRVAAAAVAAVTSLFHVPSSCDDVTLGGGSGVPVLSPVGIAPEHFAPPSAAVPTTAALMMSNSSSAAGRGAAADKGGSAGGLFNPIAPAGPRGMVDCVRTDGCDDEDERGNSRAALSIADVGGDDGDDDSADEGEARSISGGDHPLQHGDDAFGGGSGDYLCAKDRAARLSSGCDSPAPAVPQIRGGRSHRRTVSHPAKAVGPPASAPRAPRQGSGGVLVMGRQHNSNTINTSANSTTSIGTAAGGQCGAKGVHRFSGAQSVPTFGHMLSTAPPQGYCGFGPLTVLAAGGGGPLSAARPAALRSLTKSRSLASIGGDGDGMDASFRNSVHSQQNGNSANNNSALGNHTSNNYHRQHHSHGRHYGHHEEVSTISGCGFDDEPLTPFALVRGGGCGGYAGVVNNPCGAPGGAPPHSHNSNQVGHPSGGTGSRWGGGAAAEPLAGIVVLGGVGVGEASRSCPVEPRTEPFVDPCWSLSISISASTVAAVAAAAAAQHQQAASATTMASLSVGVVAGGGVGAAGSRGGGGVAAAASSTTSRGGGMRAAAAAGCAEDASADDGSVGGDEYRGCCGVLAPPPAAASHGGPSAGGVHMEAAVCCVSPPMGRTSSSPSPLTHAASVGDDEEEEACESGIRMCPAAPPPTTMAGPSAGDDRNTVNSSSTNANCSSGTAVNIPVAAAAAAAMSAASPAGFDGSATASSIITMPATLPGGSGCGGPRVGGIMGGATASSTLMMASSANNSSNAYSDVVRNGSRGSREGGCEDGDDEAAAGVKCGVLGAEEVVGASGEKSALVSLVGGAQASPFGGSVC